MYYNACGEVPGPPNKLISIAIWVVWTLGGLGK